MIEWSREILYKVLEKKNVRSAYIRVIQNMYEGISINTQTHDKEREDFSITIGLH